MIHINFLLQETTFELKILHLKPHDLSYQYVGGQHHKYHGPSITPIVKVPPQLDNFMKLYDMCYDVESYNY